MKKLTSILSLLIFGAGIQASAGEHEEVHSLTYSVYQSYRFIPMTNTDKVLATQEQARKMLPGWNATPDKLTGMFRDMYGPAAMVPGNTNMDKAQRFMSGKLSEMGVNAAEWIKTRDISVSHASFVNFKQVINGHEVVLSDLAFRFTPDGRLQRIKMKNFGTPAAGLQPELSASDVLNGTTILEGLGGVNISEKRVEPNWVWFPIPAKGGYIMHPAWTFAVNGTTSFEKPVELSGYIDAITGELLYRSNSVNETFETTVDALLYMIKPTNPRSVERVKHMTVTIAGTDYLTDDTGFVSVASANAPVNVTYKVKGPWSDVRVSNSTPTFTANMTISPSAHSLPVSDSTSSDFRAVSAFFYVNAIHDYMKSKWPSFTGMDNTPLRTNVDINGTDCNAYYSNGNYSINFYPPQGASCRAFSTVPDIVFHEYGHGISYKFYASQGTNFSNGAMGEGNSDVWAMCINQDGVVGEGSYYNGANIRSYIGTPKVYPGDIKGEVHADGEIIAGAWWDVAINTGSGDTMAKLFALTYYDTPNGPDGTEGEVYHDVLISALMNDDDDANLGNGTPHFSQIVAAFARHGIYLLSDAQFEHTEVPHQPINTAVAIKGNLVLSNPAFFDKLFLFYRDRYGAGTWDSVAMTNTTGNEYAAQIPGLPGGSIVDYFFKANDAIQASSYGLPGGYSPAVTSTELTLPYQFGFGLNVGRYKNDFEGAIDGWELGLSTDDASDGIWEQGVPGGTTSGGQQVQTDKDHTTGTGKCLITGNGQLFGSVSDDDVDNGLTTARTPVFDLPFYEPVIEYYRWYSNDRGSNSNARSDYWTVEIRTPNSGLWKRVDYTKESDQRWRRRVFRVSEYLPGASAIQMQFIAEDRKIGTLSGNGQNVVEAAVDDFLIYEGAPAGVENTGLAVQSKVYPNPADNMVHVTVPGGSNGSINLYDITGRTISITNVTDAKIEYGINTRDLPSGTYMILIQTQYAVQNTTVVVSHN